MPFKRGSTVLADVRPAQWVTLILHSMYLGWFRQLVEQGSLNLKKETVILYFSSQASSAQLADPVQQPQPARLPGHWAAPGCGHIQPLTGGVCQQGEQIVVLKDGLGTRLGDQDDWHPHCSSLIPRVLKGGLGTRLGDQDDWHPHCSSLIPRVLKGGLSTRLGEQDDWHPHQL